MKINIRGDKVKITEPIEEYIKTKLNRMDRYFDKPEEINANVFVRIRNLEQIIEVTVLTSKYVLRAEESNEDLYAAIDLVIDKLEGQLRKNKSKLKKIYKGTENQDFDFDFDTDEKESNFKIVKRKNIETKPMDEEEAILQMTLLNHDFFLFNNEDENCYSVIYLRKDGQYGIINAK